ncbi:leucyl/phenylalanyl-tRNA--protein transferase [Flavilitoribacter nigricans]|uniref:Leucyl/phenylalanyl-tRNA--protein transferase n=1 Tax=Flavilitoribacter nigricans (strain ATCC 23147 / DSM 23189 / NBRC 102662 / NCIMB 1420 / SS-2) TaxID=1122177 RepID=A0A2D0NAJ9_FLAN2|nr:leucyl/phenylalanyl-tRNA--protein transferase [Flavilitoribacter nigricans]PHN05542.1 leucyl/phenylalanyl-tRNA--protein transferase [Flavilitoribacter nigricans DSM 23189 = NBRC 102662]
MPVYLLPDDEILFPPPHLATAEGILAVGGDLSTERLLKAYRNGIFPWFNPGEPILWWSPDPRFVLYPSELRIAKSMRPYFNQQKFKVTFDQAFDRVIKACQVRASESDRRRRAIGSWITKDMITAYTTLHEQGYAHSVEVWEEEQLVGGLYGLAIGKIFFGESMFTQVSNASKFGFISLVKWLEERGFVLVDCQQETRHLASLGARSIPRREFLSWLERFAGAEEPAPGKWKN